MLKAPEGFWALGIQQKSFHFSPFLLNYTGVLGDSFNCFLPEEFVTALPQTEKGAATGSGPRQRSRLKLKGG